MEMLRKEWEQLHKKSFLKMTMEFVEELEQPNQSGSTWILLSPRFDVCHEPGVPTDNPQKRKKRLDN